MSKPGHDDVALEATERFLPSPSAAPLVTQRDSSSSRAAARDAPSAGAIAVAQVGRFVLLDTVATGGMGIVFRAHDPQLDRDVALKLIRPGACDDRQAREWLLAEARALAQLKHPNVVPVHDVAVIDDQVVMVMELVEGQTLAAWEAAAPRTWREIINVYVAAGRGLAAAHALGLVHRDFKPSNVIVGDDGRVRVIDFGLACAAGPAGGAGAGGASRAASGTTATSTLTHAVAGTPVYMAPEQLGGDEVTPASDQFSFCVALYRTLFGVRPFAADSARDLLRAVRERRVAAPANRRVPPWLRALVLRGLDPDSSARHASMAALLAELERPRRPRRWPLLAALVLASAGAASAATIALLRPEPAAAAVVEPGPGRSAADGARGLEVDPGWRVDGLIGSRARP